MVVTDAQLGAVLRDMRAKAGSRTATEVAAAASVEPPVKLTRAERGEEGLTGAELSRVLDQYGKDFLALHLALHGSQLDAEALRFLGAIATVMDQVSGR